MIKIFPNNFIFFSLLLLIKFSTSFSQQEATLHFMSSLPQVSYNNPAFFPRYKYSVGLPGSSVAASYSNNGFTYNDFAVKQGDSVIVDLNKLQKALANNNYITTTAQADIFRFSMKVNARLYLTYNLTQKIYNREMLPKSLFGIFSEGTATFVGNNVTIAPQAEATAYLESAWGAGYKINKKLTLGMRFKLLKGEVNIATQKSTVNLAVGNNYELTATADISTKTSGIHNLDSADYKVEDHWRDYLKNTGFGFDVGATYCFFDKLTIGLSLLDIGQIKWKNDLYGYSLDPATANYAFEGIDLQEILNGNDQYLQAQSDSLKKKFKFKEGRIKSYTTPLPSKIYLSGNYQIKRNFTAGALLFAENFRGRFFAGGTASLNKDFGRTFSASLSYTVAPRSFNNLGLGMSLNLAPIQLYLVSDHALITDINNIKLFNIRVGMNIVFGWDKSEEKQPFPSAEKEN